MSVESTSAVLDRYFSADHMDTSMLADDVVFTVMATGDEYRGPAAVQGMLEYFYHGVFQAHAAPRNLVVADGKAVAEFDFIGTHTGTFAGVPATGKPVRVPLCVAYDVEGDQVTRGRVYFEIPAFLAQVTGD